VASRSGPKVAPYNRALCPTASMSFINMRCRSAR
jgi:hypothetical protein